MKPQTEDFLKDLEQIFQKHKASVAVVGNRITWFVNDEEISEAGVHSNRMTIWEKLNQKNV